MIYNIDDDKIKDWINGNTTKINIENNDMIYIYKELKKTIKDEKKINEINRVILKIGEYIKRYNEENIDKYIILLVSNLKLKNINLTIKINKLNEKQNDKFVVNLPDIYYNVKDKLGNMWQIYVKFII